MTPSQIARRPARAVRRGQSGYALLTVLGLIMLCSVVIAALLGMSTTTARTVAVLDRSAAERRAADGALSAAITQMQVNAPASGTDDPCVDGALPPATDVGFDQGSPDPVDDVTVDVSCTPDAELDTGAIASTEAGGTVSIVGRTSYVGGVAWSTNCTAGNPGPGCFPWLATIGLTPWFGFRSQLSTLGPTLVHSGPQPLRIAADTAVARTAAAARNPTDAPAAIQVGGQYEQGLTGPFSAQGGGACGVLGRTHPWGASAARVLDSDVDPVCDDAASRLLDPDPIGSTPPFPVPDTEPTVPACPAGSKVIAFQPGTYGPAATAAVNDLLDGTSCAGRTFWFQPGSYSFDVDDSSAAAGDRNRLVIDDPDAKVVFGARRGWSTATGATAADFPVACDPSVSGTSISLSGRTAIAHRRGRVSICPATSPTGDAYPSVVQTDRAPTDLRPVTASSTDFTPAANLALPTSAGSQATSRQFKCTGGGSRCSTAPQTFTTVWHNSGTAALDSLRLSMAGTEENGNVGTSWRHVAITVRPAGGGSTCTGNFTGLPNGREHPISYDLLDPTRAPACRSLLTDESQLDGAQVTVSVSFDFTCFGILGCPYVNTLRLTDVQLRANTWTGAASTSSARTNGGQADWLNATNVATGSGADAEIRYEPNDRPLLGWLCTSDTRRAGFCGAQRGNDPAADRFYRLQLNDIRTATGSSPLADSDHLDTLDVLVTQNAILEGGFYDEGTTTFTLTKGTSTCSASFPTFVTTSQDTSYDLFRSTDCQSRFSEAASLAGASLTMDVRFACTPLRNLRNNPCQVWMHPTVDKVQLTATTDTYRGRPPNAQITSDGANGSSFASTGSVIVPGTDLDLLWRGQVDQTLPLISHELVVHGLGSDMTPTAQMGTVCCSPSVPATRAIRLDARIDGQVRGAATAVISDRDPGTGVREPGSRIDVLDWDLCVGGDCAAPSP